MATSTIGKNYTIKSVTVNGQSGAQGAIALYGVVSPNDIVLQVTCTNYTNCMCIPWLYDNRTCYAKTVNWSNFAIINASLTVIVDYIPNGRA